MSWTTNKNTHSLVSIKLSKFSGAIKKFLGISSGRVSEDGKESINCSYDACHTYEEAKTEVSWQVSSIAHVVSYFINNSEDNNNKILLFHDKPQQNKRMSDLILCTPCYC